MKLSALFLFRIFSKRSKVVKKNVPSNFDPEKNRHLMERMNDLMRTKKLYLQSRYSITSLASELNIPSYQLSALLNKQVGKSFSDYLNEYRIDYSKELIENGVSKNLNLRGLAKKCGFNNRNSFTVAFKKFTGNTPSSYVRSRSKSPKLLS